MDDRETPDGLLAYLITYSTYGARVHGDSRGSRYRSGTGREEIEVAPDADLAAVEKYLMGYPPFVLDAWQRAAVCEAIVEVCTHRGWELLALNVRTNHVHAVVVAPIRPELVMLPFKERSTKRLRGLGLVERDRKLWARHGSTRYLATTEGLDAALTYVLHGQGSDIPGCKPAAMMGL